MSTDNNNYKEKIIASSGEYAPESIFHKAIRTEALKNQKDSCFINTDIESIIKDMKKNSPAPGILMIDPNTESDVDVMLKLCREKGNFIELSYDALSRNPSCVFNPVEGLEPGSPEYNRYAKYLRAQGIKLNDND